eukprot:COSAG01_NODE_4109_length_5340_cov_3.390574_3_plen_87_part_00
MWFTQVQHLVRKNWVDKCHHARTCIPSIGCVFSHHVCQASAAPLLEQYVSYYGSVAYAAAFVLSIVQTLGGIHRDIGVEACARPTS